MALLNGFAKKYEMCLRSTQYVCNQQSIYTQQALVR